MIDGWTRETLQAITEKLDRNLISFRHAKCLAIAALHRPLAARTRAELIKEMYTDNPTLPTMETVAADRAAAVGESQAEELAARLKAPLPSISRTTGDMETHSPLFRESPANPQQNLF